MKAVLLSDKETNSHVERSQRTYLPGLMLSCRCWKDGDGVTASSADWLTLAAISCKQDVIFHFKTEEGAGPGRSNTDLCVLAQVDPPRDVVNGGDPLEEDAGGGEMTVRSQERVYAT